MTNKFNELCELLYDSIDKIFTSYNISNSESKKKNKYSHKIKNITSTFYTNKSNKDLNFKYITNVIKRSPSTSIKGIDWLYFIRELVIILLKKYATLFEESFHIIKNDSLIKTKLFILYVIFFHYDSISFYNENESNLHVGIDFEFNERKIALCQVAFFSSRTSKFIFIFNPNELDGIQTDFIIKFMFTSNSIVKIVHGSDSLDIPYLFQEFFMGNHLYIYDFIKNIIDIRFLCEYNKITVNYSDKKCSIYDALLYFNVINKKKYKYLLDVNNSIESSQIKSSDTNIRVTWDVHNMSDSNFKYAFYDVIYLHAFYKQIINFAKSKTKNLYKSYKYIILITRLVFLNKWDITSLSQNIKIETDSLNNYIVKYQTKKGKTKEITMINLFNSIIDKIIIHLSTNNDSINIKYLLDINYFKSTLTLIFKKIIYSILTLNFDVYKNKKDLYTDTEVPLDCNDIYLTLIDINLKDLIKFVKLFYRESYIYIINLFDLIQD